MLGHLWAAKLFVGSQISCFAIKLLIKVAHGHCLILKLFFGSALISPSPMKNSSHPKSIQFL